MAFAGDGHRGYVLNGSFFAAFDGHTGRDANGQPGTPLYVVDLPRMARTGTRPVLDSLRQAVITGQEGSPDDPTEPTGRGSVLVLGADEGDPHWRYETDAPLDGSAVEYRGTLITIDRSGRVYGLDQTNGALQWTWQAPGYSPPAPADQGPSGQTLAVSGRYVYVPHPDGSIYTLDARTGTAISATAFPARPYDLAIDDDNNAIYVRTLDGWVGAYPTSELPNQCATDPVGEVWPASGVQRVSFDTAGNQLGAPGVAADPPAMSSDGRYVAWSQSASEPGIHLRDLRDQTTTLVVPSEGEAGVLRFQNPATPELSDDGQIVAFLADARRTNGASAGRQPFVLDRDTGAVVPLFGSEAEAGTVISGIGANWSNNTYWSMPYDMSRNGRFFVVSLRAAGLVPGHVPAPSSNDVVLVDRLTGRRTIASPGQWSYGTAAFDPSVSDDGRFVAFQAHDNITGSPQGGTYGHPSPAAFQFDAQDGSLTAVSLTADGTLVRASSVDMTPDGRFVSFASSEPRMWPLGVPAASLEVPPSHAYVWDRLSGESSIASLTESGHISPWLNADALAMSDDGQSVAFASGPRFLENSVAEMRSQVSLRDAARGTTRQISSNRYDVSSNGASAWPAVSADGSRVAFLSAASDLVPDDTNSGYDVFVYDVEQDRKFLAGPTAEAPEQEGVNCGVPAPARGYSDLSVTADDIDAGELERGQDGEVEVFVHNRGTDRSEPTVVRLYDGSADDGSVISEQSLEALAPGETATLRFPWEAVPASGTRQLTVVVDPEQQVFEQDLSNNEASISVEIVEPRFDLGLAVAEPSYAAHTDAQVTATVVNRSAASRTAKLLVTLRDAEDSAIATLFDSGAALEAGQGLAVPVTWNTQDTTAGTYTVQARLLNADGDLLAVAERDLVIDADVDAQLELTTSRAEYSSQQAAQLRVLVTNDSANATLEGASVELTLGLPGALEPLRWTLPVGDISQRRAVMVTQEHPLDGLAPGVYPASAVLRATDGSELATSQASFVLRPSSSDGAGVSGTIAALPDDPEQGTEIEFALSVANDGNSALQDSRLQVQIHDAESGDLARTLSSEPRDILAGAQLASSLTTLADFDAERDYQASLHLLLEDGVSKPLDRTFFRVAPAPVPAVTVDLEVGSEARRDGVLVWACDRADEAAARTALQGASATFVPDRSEPRYANQPGCGLFTADEQRVFLRHLRSGDYNQIWILGRSAFMELRFANELAARVIHGDTLLVAGTSLGFDANLFGNRSPLGTVGSLLPMLPGSYGLTFPPGSPFAGTSATVAGLPTALAPQSASVAATTTWGIWPLRQTSTLATLNTFGNGQAIMFGASPKMISSPTAAANLLAKAHAALEPTSSPLRPSGVVRLTIGAEGGTGSPLEVRAQLPDGANLVDPPADVAIDGQNVRVPFAAGDGSRQERALWLRLPATGTGGTVEATAYLTSGAGDPVAVSTPVSRPVDLPPTRAAAVAAASSALASVKASGSSQRAKLDAIKARAAATATPSTTQPSAASRLDDLLDDIGTIERSNWSNTTPAWKAVATLATHVAFDHYRLGAQ